MKFILTNEETTRLKFRLLLPSDFDSWIALFQEDSVAKFLGMDKNKSAQAHCEEWFQKSFDRYESNTGGMNVLIDKETNQFIGQCGLLMQTVEEQERMEIGYSILPKHWKKGYATEAAQKCKEYAFENNLTDSLISIIHVDNIGSKKVAQNNGMSLEKTLQDYKGMPTDIFRVDKNK